MANNTKQWHILWTASRNYSATPLHGADRTVI